MEELRVFENAKFGEVRTIEIDGKPYFAGTDVARALGYARPNDAISAHCRATVKHSTPISGKMQEINFIPEGDLYRLIVHSKLPSSLMFERWVFDEVIPSIRKHGAYMTDDTVQRALEDPDFLIELATRLKEEKEKRKALEIDNQVKDQQIAELQPKGIFADAVSTSHTSILIGELAKILKGNGVEIGQNRLFRWLRENGYLIRRDGADFNMPTQKAMEKGLFRIKETAITKPDGSSIVTKTVKVTGEGQVYFVNLFLKKGIVA